MWLILSFFSAFFLGCYDISKKLSVNGNAVIPVLLCTVSCSALLLLPLHLLSHFVPEVIQDTIFYMPAVDLTSHALILLKSCIVLSSWIFGFFAVKHLPLTITGPVAATRPVMVLLMAIPIFGERLNAYQWAGVSITILALLLLSLSGRREGIKFTSNKWIFFCFGGAIMGAISAIYDKFIMQHVSHTAVQFWFNVYQAIMLIIVVALLWYPKRKSSPFKWRWSIPFISLFLTIADFAYFYALTDPDAMITIMSMVRRGSVLISFTGGVLLFHERNLKAKIFDLMLILIGMGLLYLGSR